MGDIVLNEINDVRDSAIDILRTYSEIKDIEQFVYVLVIFIQLINCGIFKEVDGNARISDKILARRCKSEVIKCAYVCRNDMCHRYNTKAYRKSLDNLKTLFNPNDFYGEFLSFVKEVVASVEDGTFIGKYGVPKRFDLNSVEQLELLKEE